MGNCVIATPLLSDAALLTAGSAASSMPVANLRTTQPGEVWLATDLTQAYVVADLGAAQAINLVWLGYTNATPAATVRVRAATSLANLTASPGYDSFALNLWPSPALPASWPWMHFFLWLGANPRTFQFWRLDIADAANPARYFQAGRLYLANAWQPLRNLKYGWSLQFAGDGPKDRAVGNQLYAVQQPRYRILDLTLPYLSEADMMGNGFELDRLRGSTSDMLAIRNPDVPAYLMQESVYGQAVDLPPIVNTALPIFEKRIHVEEMLP